MRPRSPRPRTAARRRADERRLRHQTRSVGQLGYICSRIYCIMLSYPVPKSHVREEACMRSALELVYALTDRDIPTGQRRDLTRDFSIEFGWRPNDFIETRSALSTASIVVEHGLDNAAVLSFLPAERRLQDIQIDERRSIVGIAYNSLVDWHVWIDRESIEYVYNRTDPIHPTKAHNFSEADYSALTKRVFDQAVDAAPNPNIPTLDGILLETIAKWRRILRSELGTAATNASISALFNAIIFARAVEDFHTGVLGESQYGFLRDHVADSQLTITEAIERSITERTRSPISESLFNRSSLQAFQRLSKGMSTEIINSFYGHPAIPYDYDFSVMSKHALSKIYERYVAVMQLDEPVQFSFFPSEPEEAWNKRLGGIYTPQYIASFFARYLRSQLSPDRFIESTILDPACGSGIFLRAVMEQKLLTSGNTLDSTVQEALESLWGVDVDENAVAASRLSLALLHLAACGELPEDVPILREDSLEFFAPGEESRNGTFDAVMMNPPFVRTELQSDMIRRAVAKHIGALARGKLDTYLAFISLSIRALRPGGFGFFVVPQPLLTSDNLAKLRNWIQDQAWIRIIADLSAIRVFDANVYVALLVVQRKDDVAFDDPPVSFIRCQRDVGLALENFLDGRRRHTYSYSMFDAPQASLRRSTWAVQTPEETDLLKKLDVMPRLKDVAVVRQGAITGADDVFMVGIEDIPSGEEPLYRPLLPDRMIGRFSVPEETGRRILYPFVNNVAVTAAQIEAEFPQTWSRLEESRERLSSRSRVANGALEWWRPMWPRPPHEMLAAKIVVPEVFLVPRFAFDVSGRWVVSHSPFVYAPKWADDQDLLFVLTALLNSSVSSWFIDSNARKYRNQYNKLGVSLLRRMPIPDLHAIPLNTLRRVADLTMILVNGASDFDRDIALSLDDMILRELYGLSDGEVALVTP